MEKQPTLKPRRQKAIVQKMDAPQSTIILGKNVFVQSTLDGIQIKQSLSPSTSRTVVSLGAREFRQLLAFSNVIMSAIKKRPEKAKTLNEYETLLHHQSKFLLGKNIYVRVSHVEEESQIQFIEYMIVNSMSVSGESVVCPGRFLLGLNRKQFEELISHKTLLKPKTTKNLSVKNRKTETESVPSTDPDSKKSTATQTERNIVQREDVFGNKRKGRFLESSLKPNGDFSLPPKKKARLIDSSNESMMETTPKIDEQKIPVLISNREQRPNLRQIVMDSLRLKEEE